MGRSVIRVQGVSDTWLWPRAWRVIQVTPIGYATHSLYTKWLSISPRASHESTASPEASSQRAEGDSRGAGLIKHA